MDTPASLLLIDGPTVEALLADVDLVALMREALIAVAAQQASNYPVVRERVPDGVFGIKSGVLPARSLLGCKVAGFWPGNRARRGDAHQATVLLVDPASGRPHCLLDGNAITTARTAAAGAVGLAALAPPRAQRLALFGSGVQARAQAQAALAQLPQLQRIDYCTRSGAPEPGFEAALTPALRDRCTLVHMRDTDAAVAAAEVVVTATPGGGALFSAAALRPGTHLNCVGTDTRGKRELPPGVLTRARVFVDDLVQARQLGELQWAPEVGATPLGALLAQPDSWTRGAEDITVFDLTGLAVQDLVAADAVRAVAEARGRGTRIDWPWQRPA